MIQKSIEEHIKSIKSMVRQVKLNNVVEYNFKHDEPQYVIDSVINRVAMDYFIITKVINESDYDNSYYRIVINLNHQYPWIIL